MARSALSLFACLVVSATALTGCRTAKKEAPPDALEGCQVTWDGPVRKFDCGALSGSDQSMPGGDASLDEVIAETTKGVGELSVARATWKSAALELPEPSAKAVRFSWADSPGDWFREWYFVVAGGGSRGIRSLSCGTRDAAGADQALGRCEAIIRSLIVKPLPEAPRPTELDVLGTKVAPRKDCRLEPGKLLCPEAVLEVLAKAPGGEPDAVLELSVTGISNAFGGLKRDEAFACLAYGVASECREISFVEKDGTQSAAVIAYPIAPEVPNRLSCFYRDGPLPPLCGVQRSK